MTPEKQAIARGLLIEGGATNLISMKAVSEAFYAQIANAYELRSESELGEGACWVFRIPPESSIALKIEVELPKGSPALTESCFCWTWPLGGKIGLELRTTENAGRRTYSTAGVHQRHQLTVPIPLDTSHCELSFQFGNPTKQELEFFFAYPCVERSAFASTPVLPGLTRTTELVDVNEPLVIAKGQFGAFLSFIPLLAPWEWGAENDGCLFGAFTVDGLYGIELSIGRSSGKVQMCITNAGERKAVEVAVWPMKDAVSGVGVVQMGGEWQLIVDGVIVERISGMAMDAQKFSKVRLGNHPLSSERPSYILFRRFVCHSESLEAWDIQRVFAEIEPERYWYFVPTLERFKEAEAQRWPSELVGPLLRIPNRWQQMPPLWCKGDGGLDEGVFRDDVCNCLEFSGIHAVAESQTAAGRTDALVYLSERPSIRMEFKIWGRHDYAEIPVKPIKYMTDDEEIAVVVMLNPNQVPIEKQYIRNVLNGPIECTGHVENPYSEYTGVFHFATEHRVGDRHVHVLHLVFNIKSPYLRAYS